MADYTANLDGSMTLEQTRDRCQVEQTAGFQLESIKFGTITERGKVLLVNKAEFRGELDWLGTLLFVVVGTNDPVALRAQKEAEGWTFICDSQIYIQNNVTKVMVFGKK